MRDWIHLAVVLVAALAVPARAQSASPPPGAGAPLPSLPPPIPSQIVVVPDSPPPPPPAQAPDGGSAVVVIDVPAAGNDGGNPPVVAGEPDAGPSEEIILLVPKRPPPPPEPPRQITVTVMHIPRPRVEWGQASVELGVSSGVYLLGAGALLVGELLPIVIVGLFDTTGTSGVAGGLLDAFAVANAVVLPLAGVITIEKLKAYSQHYQLEGLGWWATYGVGLVVQSVIAAVTIATTDANSYYEAAPLVVGFGLITPISQTVLAQVLATPRDPAAPIEGMTRRPVLDGKGRPIPIVNVLSVSF